MNNFNQTQSATLTLFKSQILIALQGIACLVAIVGSGWLLLADLNSSSNFGLPGCGGVTNGCQTLASSPWSKWLGIPVSVWGISFVAIQTTFWGCSLRSRVSVAWLMAGVSWSALGVLVAAWFFYVMKVRVGEYCLLCLVVHGANTACFFLALARLEFSTADPAGYLFNWRYPFWKVLSLAALLGQFALIYWGSSATGLEIRPINEIKQVLTVAKLDPSEIQTVKGNANAERIIVIYTCLTCPACRQVNALIAELIQSDQLRKSRVEVRFFPLSTNCNPQLAELQPLADKFRGSRACELARISLAVAASNPEAFSEFIDQVYEDSGQSVEEARKLARDCVGADFDQIYFSDQIQKRISMDLEIARQFKVTQVPQLFVEGGVVSGDFDLISLRNFLRDQ